MKYADLGREYNIPPKRIQDWFQKRLHPRFISTVLRCEDARIEWEKRFSHEAFANIVEPSKVYRTFLPLKNRESIHRISYAIKEIIQDSIEGCAVGIIVLSPYTMKYGPRWMLDLKDRIQNHQDEIEKSLNHLFKPDSSKQYRIGIVEDRLYIRAKEEKQEPDYVHLLSDEMFYFTQDYKQALISETRKKLGVNGNYTLSKIIGHLAKPERVEVPKYRLLSELSPQTDYLFGHTLEMMLDILGLSFKEIEDNINHIGVSGQILHPKLSSSETYLDIFTRLYSIVISDGNIESGAGTRIFYAEKDPNRRYTVSNLVQKLGGVGISESKSSLGEVNGLIFTSVLGRMMHKLGIPRGDKMVQEPSLPSWIINGDTGTISAYLEELLPEEAWITFDYNKARIGIGRSKALYAPNASETYGFTNLLSSEVLKVITRNQYRVERSFGTGSEYVYYEATMKELRELSESGDDETTRIVRTALKIIESHPPTLLLQEREICQKIGIAMTQPKLRKITFSDATQRITAQWETLTRRLQDVVRWFEIAPPNDIVKYEKLSKWVEEYRNRIGAGL
ncbi:MAG: hypothetical protein P1Q69_04600 [Candidatus Thorarchaeota archaeon]|nr:hypothetical protein [Candidatus Thorarchaeota archaeon]